jgi:hypothetical protein
MDLKKKLIIIISRCALIAYIQTFGANVHPPNPNVAMILVRE